LKGGGGGRKKSWWEEVEVGGMEGPPDMFQRNAGGIPLRKGKVRKDFY